MAHPARAQALLDGHGAVPPAGDGDPDDPLHTWSPERQDPGAIAVSTVFEMGRGMLVRYVQPTPDPESVYSEALLKGLVGMNLTGSYGVSKRVAVSAAMPVWFFSSGLEGGGPAAGDLHVWAPIGLKLPTDEGLGLSVVPWLDLPTGAEQRRLGDPGLGAGALLAAGTRFGALSVDGNLGLQRRGWSADVASGGAARGALAFGYLAQDDLAFHLESTYTQGLRAPEGSAGNAPAIELLLSARGRQSSGVWWVGGLGRGVTSGVGSAALRAYVGVGFTRPGDGGAGTPQAVSATVLRVLDENGEPVRGALVELGRRPVGITDGDGRVQADTPWRRDLVVRAEGYEPATVAPPSEEGPVEVVLRWSPSPLAVSVRAQDGAAVPATVTVTGPSEVPSVTTVDGLARLELTPGTWTIAIDSPELGHQERVVTVEPGRRAPLAIEALLAPDEGDATLVLALADAEGRPLEGARVLIDGKPVGTTGSGGRIELADLAEGRHRVEVGAEGFQTVEQRDLELGSGSPTEASLVLRRLPGSVKVVARGPDGRILDAVARFEGPSRLSPQPLGQYGERIFVLRPGTWQVLVMSPTYGLQQRELVVPEHDTSLIVVEVVLQPAEDGEAELVVRVVDPDGVPVAGAEVALDGKTVGQTSTGGTVRLQELMPGARELVVGGEHFREQPPTGLVLTEGLQERVVTLWWEPGTVRVSARGPEGAVGDATARFAGAAPTPALPLGSDGIEYTTLPPGDWNVVVASAAYGLQQRVVLVPEDGRSLVDVDVAFSPPEGGRAELAVRVLDPEGRPVPNAQVRLDGTPLGATSTGGTLTLGGLDAGSRQLAVAAEPFQTRVKRVSLIPGTYEAEIRLDYAPGAVKVLTRSAGGPVTDAVVRFAGPEVRPPTPVDASGERFFQLAPGTWQAVVLSPRFGLQQREITVSADSKNLQVVTFDLQPMDAGQAELLVRVQDPDGRPIPGADVRVGGEDKGRSSAGGALLVASLDPGPVSVEVSAPDFVPRQLAELDLVEGSQERIVTLDFVPRTVEVRVTDQSGAPVDAEVRFDGPADVVPKRVGSDGIEVFELRPGTWQVLASAEALGTGRKQVLVADGKASVELVLKPARVDVTEGQVLIREQVMFDFNSAVLRREADAVLDEVAATLLAQADIAQVEVQGHTDDLGAIDVNQQLSQARAEAVKAALVARGVAPERLLAQGYGATRPITPNTDDASRAKNRRVQFEIVD